jgi:nucleoside-diphosphate-sugar epimerase
MATYLVTGGAGFIGSHIVEELVRRGESVRVLDNLSTGREENLAAVRGQIEWHKADVRDLEGIRPAFRGAEYVIHEAALSSVPGSIADPVAFNAVNVGGTLHVLVAARDAGVKRVVLASSASVYGDNTALPLVESEAPRFLSPYAFTKYAGEQYCQLFTRLGALETVCLRYFNVFGPRQDPGSPYSGVLSIFFAAYQRGEAPTVFGDGEQTRDFVFVENVADATLRACSAPNVSGKAINVGMGEQRTLNQTLQLLNTIYEREVKPSYGSPRPGDIRHSRADISRARRLLGYEPKIGFEAGLRKSIDWHRGSAR